MNIFKHLDHVTAMLLTALLVTFAHADNPAFKQAGDYKIYFSAFNSSFIQPDIASIYDIVRGKDKGMVNVAVVKNGETTGTTAVVSGYVSNIFQQQQFLEFFEVREGNAVYYLAPFEFEDEDHLTFKLKVTPAGSASEAVSFQRTFYHD